MLSRRATGAPTAAPGSAGSEQHHTAQGEGDTRRLHAAQPLVVHHSGE
jgi:hypothetical protein